MNIQVAYDKLQEYAEGGLEPVERADLERLLQEQPELREALQVCTQLDRSLRGQEWIQPSADFTRLVMMKVEAPLIPNAPVIGSRWERVKVAVSVAALLVMLAFYGKSMAGLCGSMLSDTGNLVGTFTGLSLFAMHPIVLLGLLAPVLAGGYATCVLTGRCRLSS